MNGARQIGALVLGATLVVAMLLVPSQAEARVGRLDPSFGTGGQVQLEPVVSRLVAGADGSVTFLSYEAVGRVLADGQPDPEFGEGGSRPLESQIEGLPFVASGLAVDSQKRVVVFGAVSDPLQHAPVLGSIGPGSVEATWAAALRFKADGSLDPSFGEGKGFVRSDFGLRSEVSVLGSEEPISISTTIVFSGAVDSRDRPVLLVGVANRYGPCNGHGSVDPTPRAIVRLTPDGSTDLAFGGGDGIVPLEGKPTPLYTELRVVADDQPVAVTGSGGCRGPIAFHADSSGSPLPGFGADGILYRDQAFGAIDPSGALILKRGWPAAEVARIAPNGRLDRTFGKDGVAAVKMPAGLKRTLRPVGFDSGGRMILVGSFVLPPKSRGGKAEQEEQAKNRRGYLLVMRLLPSGRLDPSFGRRGRIATPLGHNRKASVTQAALDPEGRLVLLSSLSAPFEQGLVRYLLGA